MIPAVRQERILELLSAENIKSTDDLMSHLDISISTLRRDLNKLSSAKKIVLLHGGGVRLLNKTPELALTAKLDLNNSAKLIIAKKAVSYIEPNDVIFIDPSSTTFKMIEYLPKNITVCTNSIAHITKLNSEGIKAIMIGGTIKKSTNSCIGPIAEDTLKNLNFDKSFLGANGFSIQAGITNHDINERTIKKIALQNSIISYFLLDHTKFNSVTMVNVCSIGEYPVITDKIFEPLHSYKNFIDANK